MRVLLAPHGTRGDVQPAIALAIALRARGHEARFVAPSNAVDEIRRSGFEADANGVDIQAVMRSHGADTHSLRWLTRQLLESLAPLFDSVAAASADADLIVGAGAQIPAASVAEWRDVPYVSAVFCPCAIPSSAIPPPTVRTQTLPHWMNRLLWQAGGPAGDLLLRSAINRGRLRLGLRPIHDPLTQLINGPVIVAADPDLAPFPDDGPAGAVSTDAWILENAGDLDPRIDAFLARDPAPVYVGFGSMIAARGAELADLTLAAVRAVGRAAIIAGGWAQLDRRITDASVDDVLTVEAVPHSLVLPRVSAAIHHGGAGTTTAVARAGVPQVILPHLLDQYYWAHRVETLGLGSRPMPVQLVTADILSARLDTALHDLRVRQQAAVLGRAIASRNGVAAAVDYLEALA